MGNKSAKAPKEKKPKTAQHLYGQNARTNLPPLSSNDKAIYYGNEFRLYRHVLSSSLSYYYLARYHKKTHHMHYFIIATIDHIRSIDRTNGTFLCISKENCKDLFINGADPRDILNLYKIIFITQSFKIPSYDHDIIEHILQPKELEYYKNGISNIEQFLNSCLKYNTTKIDIEKYALDRN